MVCVCLVFVVFIGYFGVIMVLLVFRLVRILIIGGLLFCIVLFRMMVCLIGLLFFFMVMKLMLDWVVMDVCGIRSVLCVVIGIFISMWVLMKFEFSVEILILVVI